MVVKITISICIIIVIVIGSNYICSRNLLLVTASRSYLILNNFSNSSGKCNNTW